MPRTGRLGRQVFRLGPTAVLVALVSSAFGAEPELLPGKPDIWGVWVGTGGYPDIDPRYRNTPWPTVGFTAWGSDESNRLGKPEPRRACLPSGPAAYMNGGNLFPIEIARTTTGFLVLYEPSQLPRRIYTDGRGHPDDLDPTWLGHSVGRWEGDTLVVDTVGLNGRTRPLNGDAAGSVNSTTDTTPRLPGSDQMHMIERIRVVGNGEYLEDEITFDDPKTYTQAFTVKKFWQRRADLDLLESACDNLRPEDEGHSEGEP